MTIQDAQRIAGTLSLMLLAMLFSTATPAGLLPHHCEPKREAVSPACHPTFGYHPTCWRRFPPVPECNPCPTCQDCQNLGSDPTFGAYPYGPGHPSMIPPGTFPSPDDPSSFPAASVYPGDGSGGGRYGTGTGNSPSSPMIPPATPGNGSGGRYPQALPSAPPQNPGGGFESLPPVPTQSGALQLPYPTAQQGSLGRYGQLNVPPQVQPSVRSPRIQPGMIQAVSRPASGRYGHPGQEPQPAAIPTPRPVNAAPLIFQTVPAARNPSIVPAASTKQPGV